VDLGDIANDENSVEVMVAGLGLLLRRESVVLGSEHEGTCVELTG
jgi:hypothetical protein